MGDTAADNNSFDGQIAGGKIIHDFSVAKSNGFQHGAIDINGGCLHGQTDCNAG